MMFFVGLAVGVLGWSLFTAVFMVREGGGTCLSTVAPGPISLGNFQQSASAPSCAPCAHLTTPQFSRPLAPKGWSFYAVWAGHPSDPLLKETLTSQCGQDSTVQALYNNKRGGYFVDLAANDAIHWSNTLHLEQQLGWGGLCIEANEKYAHGFRGRSCQFLQAVVGHQDNEEVTFDFVPHFAELGGIVGCPGCDRGEAPADPNFPQFRAQRLTVSINSIFSAFSAPPTIDYLSLDIEGAELHAMSSFNFSTWKIMSLSVERPSEALQQLLSREGFIYVCNSGPWDMFFVHSTFPDFEEAVLRIVASAHVSEGKWQRAVGFCRHSK